MDEKPEYTNLQQKLADYLSKYPNPPAWLRNTIHEFWREFIDGVKQDDPYDKFETQSPGYLAGMVAGKNYRHQYGMRPITLSFLMNMHKFLMINVHHVRDDIEPGFLRRKDISFRLLFNWNISLNGFNECIDRFEKGEDGFLLYANSLDPGRMVDDILVGNFYPEFMLLRRSEGGGDTNNTDPKYIRKEFIALFDDPTWKITVETQDIDLTERINLEIKNYYQALAVCDKYDDVVLKRYHQITAIVKFAQILVQLHPFVDGNCRLFVMQVIPKLLNDIGLGNICIFDNPNHFGMYSIEECVEDVINALINAQQITQKKKNYLTTDFPHPYIKDGFNDYFLKCFMDYPGKPAGIVPESVFFKPLPTEEKSDFSKNPPSKK